MATQLGYTPPTPSDSQAQAEVDDLVAALHESGLLRVLAGGARSYPQLLGHLLAAVDADTLRSAVALAGALRDLDPEESEKVAEGIRRARREATRAASGEPESPWRLLKRLKDPDTRRGMSAALAGLAALGRSLPR